MEAAEIVGFAARGEDSYRQFKVDFTNAISLAAEMSAFCNSNGGKIFIGITDGGNITGLSQEDVKRLNQLFSNAASQLINPPINPVTENIVVNDKLIIVVTIAAGISKPYVDNSGAIWVKNGADKRKVTSREEMQRIFQSSGLVYADEVEVSGASIIDLDINYFGAFYQKVYEDDLTNQELPLSQLLNNMNLAKGDSLNLTGLLVFGKNPQKLRPAFMIKAVAYPGNDIHVSEYRDNEDIHGKVEDLFKEVMSFITRNIRRIQNGQDVNSLGKLEVPKIALEELVVNSLIHRDYFISAPIRVFIFDNRIEILSPGHLPNCLTIENIKKGNANLRNPALASYATKILPYRGLGNGIRRALREYPDISFEDDREGNLFKVTIQRRG